MTADYLIGIDTGVHTGLALWDAKDGRLVELKTHGIVHAMGSVSAWLDEAREQGRNCLLVMEDARLRKWIPRERNLSEFKGRLMGAGSVKRDAAIWEEFAEVTETPLIRVKPREGMTKWSAQYFAAVTGYKGRCSNHARDAALLVWGKTPMQVEKTESK